MTALVLATIAESLFADLRIAMDAGAFDSTFTRTRLWREAEKLHGVDAINGLIAKSWLAALDRDVGAVCRYTQAAILQHPDAHAIGAVVFALVSTGLLPQAADVLEKHIEVLAENGEILSNAAAILVGTGRLTAALNIAHRFVHLSARLKATSEGLQKTVEDFRQRGLCDSDFISLSDTLWRTFQAFHNGEFIGRLRGDLIYVGDESDSSDGREHAIYVRYTVASPADADLSALIDLCMAVDEALAREHPDNPAALYWTCNFVPFEPQAVGSRAA